MEKTLEEAITKAKRKALADVYEFSDPFSAVQYRKTLPKGWQLEVEKAIVEIYHNTQPEPEERSSNVGGE